MKKSCAKCAYDMGPSWDDCAYNDPQDGSVNPPEMFAEASMPDRRNGGSQCHHFQQAIDGR